MNGIEGPRYAVVCDGVIVARRESKTLAIEDLMNALREDDFLEIKFVNVRMMQQVLGFIDENLAEEIAGFSMVDASKATMEVESACSVGGPSGLSAGIFDGSAGYFPTCTYPSCEIVPKDGEGDCCCDVSGEAD